MVDSLTELAGQFEATRPRDEDLGRLSRWLEKNTGIPPGTGQAIFNRARPALVAFEMAAGQGPPPEAVHAAVRSEVYHQLLVAQQMGAAIEALVATTQQRWQEQRIQSDYFNETTGERFTFTESQEMFVDRLTRVHQAKIDWDARVAASRHQDPARLGAFELLAPMYGNADPGLRGQMADQVVAVMKQLVDHSTSLKAVPEQHRGPHFWKGLAEIAWIQVYDDLNSETALDTTAIGLELAVKQLEQELGDKLRPIYEAVVEEELDRRPGAQRLDVANPRTAKVAEVNALIHQAGLENQLRFEANGMVITENWAKGQRLNSREREISAAADPVNQALFRIQLLRLLTGKSLLSEEAVRGTLKPNRQAAG